MDFVVWFQLPMDVQISRHFLNLVYFVESLTAVFICRKLLEYSVRAGERSGHAEKPAMARLRILSRARNT